MKTIRLVSIVLFVFGIVLSLLNVNYTSAQIPDKENIKFNGEWILHSMHDGDTSIIYHPDADTSDWLQIVLSVDTIPNPDTSTTCWNRYKCYRWRPSSGKLNYSDTLWLKWYAAGNVTLPTPQCYKMHVKEVTLTLKLKRLSPLRGSVLDDSMYVEYIGGADSLYRALSDTCSWWHEVWPHYSPLYHLDSIRTAPISYCDTITLRDTQGNRSRWHVRHVGIDVTFDSHMTVQCPPETPTITQWGLIILVALLVSSAVFILLKRRKTTVPV